MTPRGHQSHGELSGSDSSMRCLCSHKEKGSNNKAVPLAHGWDSRAASLKTIPLQKHRALQPCDVKRSHIPALRSSFERFYPEKRQTHHDI